MLVYPNKEFGIRPRNAPKDILRKQRYWTQGHQEPPPWYVWDTNMPKQRSKSEERSTVTKHPPRTAELEIENSFRNYLQTSTLHGLRYIGQRQLTWCERIFWLTAFVCSLMCAGFFILNVYAKWRLSPMIVSINPKNLELEELPFPALTICNMNQAKKSVATRYLEEGDRVDNKLLRNLCSSREDAARFEDDIAGSADWYHTRQFLINVTQPCNEMVAQCIWDSSTMNCEDLFNAQLTDEGLCCTFNAVHRNKMFRNPSVYHSMPLPLLVVLFGAGCYKSRRGCQCGGMGIMSLQHKGAALNDLNLTFPSPSVDWTPEDGYPADAPPDGFPWRPKGVGTQHGLSLVLDANIDEYFCASTKSAGFKILMHNPTETPKVRNLGEIYAPGIEARIAIYPKISDAQPTLRSIDIDKRLCLFSSEKELVFFRTYTLKNCQMECEARAMLDVCKCVYYYMPKNKTTRICGKSDSKCYANMSKILPGRDVTCEECLPACTEIAYIERFSWAPLRNSLVAKLARNVGNRTLDYFTENMLVIHFYFDEDSFIRFTKGEIFGLTEFLSNTGGLLGLCMGFSIMSVVELVYYLTLRALCKTIVRH